jgi:MASE1
MTVGQLALPTSLRSIGREPPQAHQLGSDAVRLILIGLAYFTFAYLGLRLASVNPSATPIWVPTGLAIAAVLLWGNRIAPAIFIAAFLINQLTAGSIFTSLAIAGGNTLEAVTAGYLVRHWAQGEQVFDTPTGIAKFTLISLAATMVSATIGVSSLTVAGYAEVSSFISVWLTWWLGDLAGALVVTPVVVLWCKSKPASLRPPEITGTALTYFAAVAVGVMVFGCPVMHSRSAGFSRRSAVAVGVPPSGPTRYRYRGAYHFRIRGWVYAVAVRALRQAKPERLIHTVAGLHYQHCSALPCSEHRRSRETAH